MIENSGLLLTLKREQLKRQRYEAHMLRCLGEALGGEFHPKSLPLPGGGVMEIGGYSAQANAVCEIYPGEREEMTEVDEETMLLNALKLRYFAQVAGNNIRQILLFQNAAAANRFCGSHRVRAALGDDTGVEVCVMA